MFTSVSHCTLSPIRDQWLGVVDKIATFPRFSEFLKEHVEKVAKCQILVKCSWLV